MVLGADGVRPLGRRQGRAPLAPTRLAQTVVLYGLRSREATRSSVVVAQGS